MSCARRGANPDPGTCFYGAGSSTTTVARCSSTVPTPLICPPRGASIGAWVRSTVASICSPTNGSSSRRSAMSVRTTRSPQRRLRSPARSARAGSSFPSPTTQPSSRIGSGRSPLDPRTQPERTRAVRHLRLGHGAQGFAARLPAADARQFSPLGRRGWLLGTGGVELSRELNTPVVSKAFGLPVSTAGRHRPRPLTSHRPSGSARVVVRPGRNRSVIAQKVGCLQVRPQGVWHARPVQASVPLDLIG